MLVAKNLYLNTHINIFQGVCILPLWEPILPHPQALLPHTSTPVPHDRSTVSHNLLSAPWKTRDQAEKQAGHSRTVFHAAVGSYSTSWRWKAGWLNSPWKSPGNGPPWKPQTPSSRGSITTTTVNIDYVLSASHNLCWSFNSHDNAISIFQWRTLTTTQTGRKELQCEPRLSGLRARAHDHSANRLKVERSFPSGLDEMLFPGLSSRGSGLCARTPTCKR